MPLFKAGFWFAEKPEHGAQGDDGYRQGNQGKGLNLVQIEDDHFSRQCHQGDHDNRFDLDDAFFARRYLNDGMLEFHGNEDGHDHAENGLEGTVLQRIEPAQYQSQKYLLDQPEQGKRHHDRDDDRYRHRDDLFEPLIKIE